MSRQQRRAAVRRAEAIDLDAHVHRVAAVLWQRANQGLFHGREDAVAGAYMARCRVADVATGTVLLFTRDAGMHTSGWFKNPDYERCYHLSLSPLANASGLVDARGEPEERRGATAGRLALAGVLRPALAADRPARGGLRHGIHRARVALGFAGLRGGRAPGHQRPQSGLNGKEGTGR